MNPEQLAKCGTEHGMQSAFFCWVAQNASTDDRLENFYANPMGGKRDKVTASRMKAEGARRGVPDTHLAVPRFYDPPQLIVQYCGLYIEFKLPKYINHKNGGCSDDQMKWIDRLTRQNYLVQVCYSWLTAAQLTVDYLQPHSTISLDFN